MVVTTSKIRRRMMCVLCQRRCELKARNLCSTCYSREAYHGRIDQWPMTNRSYRSTENTLTRYHEIVTKSDGTLRFADIAEQIGVSTYGLRNTVKKARRRGDPRAVYHRQLAKTCAERSLQRPTGSALARYGAFDLEDREEL